MRRNTYDNYYLKRTGSLTIEASLVMPLFMFMMICIISLSSLLLFQLRVKECLHEEVKLIAMKSINNGYPNHEEIKGNILSSIGDDFLKIAPIEEGSNGIVITEDFTDEIVKVSATYKAGLYYDLFHLFGKSFTQSCVQHNWEGFETGYIHGINENKEEIYVYITNDSEVYHLSNECTHINLNITTISAENLKNARNTDGGKYKSCEHCHSKISDGNFYITPEGNKYHNSLGCSGLKRTIIAVPLSEVSGKRPCSRCGK